MRLIVSVTSLLLLAVPGVGTAQQADGGLAYERSRNSVVRVVASASGPQDVCSQDVGTGFIVSTEGHIVTANHVLLDPSRCENLVVLVYASSREEPVVAEVLSRDASSDSAILRLSQLATDIRPISVGFDTRVRTGDTLYAVGFAQGRREMFSARLDVANTSGNRIFANGGVGRGYSGGPVFDADCVAVGYVSGAEGDDDSRLIVVWPASAIRRQASDVRVAVAASVGDPQRNANDCGASVPQVVRSSFRVDVTQQGSQDFSRPFAERVENYERIFDVAEGYAFTRVIEVQRESMNPREVEPVVEITNSGRQIRVRFQLTSGSVVQGNRRGWAHFVVYAEQEPTN